MKVLVSVFSNLYTDQRVEKVCRTLHQHGYEVILIGNSWGGLKPLNRPYETLRIDLKSKNLKSAYPEFNFKLYHELLKRADSKTLLLANDLDTLLANHWVSKKKKIPLIFDSHEIYTEMPSVQGRFTQKIWRFLEKKILPELSYFITASESYADWFARKYKINRPVVVQNFPLKQNNFKGASEERSKKVIIYQGAINPSRGLDKMISTMRVLPEAELWIFGSGPKQEEYQILTKNLVLEDRVLFFGAVLPEELRKFTLQADVGLSIEEPGGLSYFYSLPNKVADYVQAGVPVVTSAFPEMKKIVEKFGVGETITNHSEAELASKISSVLKRGKAAYRDNLLAAASEMCWEKEEPKLLEVFQKAVKENFN